MELFLICEKCKTTVLVKAARLGKHLLKVHNIKLSQSELNELIKKKINNTTEVEMATAILAKPYPY